MAEDEAEADPFLGGLLAPALLGTAYAAWLSTEDGKEWIDENTTLGVVLGVSGILATLRLTLTSAAWGRVVGAFVAAGAPLVVRGLLRRLA
jgi:hypothetical protein